MWMLAKLMIKVLNRTRSKGELYFWNESLPEDGAVTSAARASAFPPLLIPGFAGSHQKTVVSDVRRIASFTEIRYRSPDTHFWVDSSTLTTKKKDSFRPPQVTGFPYDQTPCTNTEQLPAIEEEPLAFCLFHCQLGSCFRVWCVFLRYWLDSPQTLSCSKSQRCGLPLNEE